MDATVTRYSDSEWRIFLTEQEQELRPYLRGLARAITRNEAKADDLVQETLMKALLNSHQFMPGTNFKAWVSMIMRNQFYSETRRSWRWQALDTEVAERTLTTGGMPAQQSHLEWQELLAFLPCLPPEQRDVLIAVGYLGWTYESTAEAFRVVVGTVKSRVSRARNGLSALMATTTPGLDEQVIQELKTATRTVPRGHPLYLIAEAYEELYAEFEIPPHYLRRVPTSREQKPSTVKGEKAWQDLIRSGALETDAAALEDLFAFDSDP